MRTTVIAPPGRENAWGDALTNHPAKRRGAPAGHANDSPLGQKSEIGTDGVFVELALIPNTDFVAHLVERDPNGRIIVDSGGATSVPGIFAAGDVTNTSEQVLVAIGEGAKAALKAYEYLLPSL